VVALYLEISMMAARKMKVLSLNKSTALGLHLKMLTLQNLLAENL
jgi:hypothetical protein